MTGKILIGALALGVTGCVTSDRGVRTEAGIVKIIRVKGMARYSDDQRGWHELKKDMQFKAGVLLQTAPKSVVDVCMNDGHPDFPRDGSEKTSPHVIRIFENTALSIDRLIKEESGKQFSEVIALDLRAGQMLGNVGMMFPESRYEIKLPKGQVEVLGGVFMVSSSKVINVLRGTVVTSKANADGSESRIEVHSGESFDPTTGTLTRLTTDDTWIEYYPLDSPICGVPLPQPIELTPNSGVPHGTGMGRSLQKFP